MNLLSNDRLNELKERFILADNSGAGKAAKEAAIKELREYAKLFNLQAEKNPATKVAQLLRQRAGEIERFIIIQEGY